MEVIELNVEVIIVEEGDLDLVEPAREVPVEVDELDATPID
jgi:hypothetical protein